jgi:hypothetical protein
VNAGLPAAAVLTLDCMSDNLRGDGNVLIVAAPELCLVVGPTPEGGSTKSGLVMP